MMFRATCLFLLYAISISFANVLPRVQSFIEYELVPDILNTPPASVLSVIFPSGVEANEGEEVPLVQIVEEPTVTWNADPDRIYTVLFVDPDAPSREDHSRRSVLHWLVVNVPGSDVKAGDTIATFLNSQPRPGSGLHRYVFLVYEQHEIINIGHVAGYSEERIGFTVGDFTSALNLGSPLAGNFYQTQNLEKA